MIEVRDISKSFAGNKALDGVSFRVEKGEILGFLGPNGAGKTTTLKIITSFWSPDQGTVEIDGRDVAKDPLFARRRIGYLPEMVPLYEEMKVKEYLSFVADIRGLDKKRKKQRMEEIALSCGIKEVMNKPIEELSKGYRQRAGLAQAIIHDSDVLVLDEPTTGLDPNQIVEIRELIKRIGQEKTVIFSTHILSEVKAVCDRVLIINKGKIVGEGTPEELAGKARSQQMIYAKIKGFKEQILEKLGSMKGVANVRVKDKESERVYGYEIEPEPDLNVDIREHLFRAIQHWGWNILEFSKKEASLEEVFRELTK